MITVWHRLANLVMPIGDPRDGFFYPTLTLMMYYYIILLSVHHKVHAVHHNVNLFHPAEKFVNMPKIVQTNQSADILYA